MRTRLNSWIYIYKEGLRSVWMVSMLVCVAAHSCAPFQVSLTSDSKVKTGRISA